MKPVAVFSGGFHARIDRDADSVDWLARGGRTGPGFGQYRFGSTAQIGGTQAIPRGTGVAHVHPVDRCGCGSFRSSAQSA